VPERGPCPEIMALFYYVSAAPTFCIERVVGATTLWG